MVARPAVVPEAEPRPRIRGGGVTGGTTGRSGRLASATALRAPSLRAPRAAGRPAAVVGAGRMRVDAVDVLRGVIMILMALDNTRDFFGDAAANPTDLATTSGPLFFTRWVTHFCAPVFFLLTGTGASLSLGRTSVPELSRFLLTRGLLLIVLEATVVRALWQFNVDYRVTILNVLWALGWSMIVLAILVRLPRWVAPTFGLALIALHNLADGVRPVAFGALAPLWNVLHQPGMLLATPRTVVFVAYPLIPWIGVAAAGYGLGEVYRWSAERRRAFLLRAGVGLTLAFVALRAIDVYGDPRPWAAHARAGYTALSFLNTNKYPPSLLFLLMTLGPALLFLWRADGREARLLRPALVIGRVPLCYYLLHVALLHLLAVVAGCVRYGDAHWMFESPSLDRFPMTQPAGWPLPLPAVYLVWALVVALLYPCCRWYAALKARRADVWLRYI